MKAILFIFDEAKTAIEPKQNFEDLKQEKERQILLEEKRGKTAKKMEIVRKLIENDSEFIKKAVQFNNESIVGCRFDATKTVLQNFDNSPCFSNKIVSILDEISPEIFL